MGLNATWKARLAAADGQPCPYCNHPMDAKNWRMAPTRDHIYPRTFNTAKLPRMARRMENFVVVCFRCNNRKGNMTLHEYRGWLQLNGYPRFATCVGLFIAARQIEFERGQRKTPQDLRPTGSDLSSECVS